MKCRREASDSADHHSVCRFTSLPSGLPHPTPNHRFPPDNILTDDTPTLDTHPPSTHSSPKDASHRYQATTDSSSKADARPSTQTVQSIMKYRRETRVHPSDRRCLCRSNFLPPNTNGFKIILADNISKLDIHPTQFSDASLGSQAIADSSSKVDAQ